MAIDFRNVTDWTIPEGNCVKVYDSTDSIIWQKDTYTDMDYVTCSTYPTGIIVPVSIPMDASYEIFMDFQPTSASTDTAVLPMGGWSRTASNCKFFTFEMDYTYYSSGRWTDNVGYWNSDDEDVYRYEWVNSRYTSFSAVNRHTITNTDITTTHYDVTNSRTIGTSYQTACRWNSEAAVNGYYGFGIMANKNGGNYGNTYGTFIGNIYGAHIIVNGVTLYNFKPVKRNKTGEYGLYDTVNNVFYTSMTSNPFTHIDTPISSISLTDTEVGIGLSKRIPRVINPNYTSASSITWTSSDPSVATVNENGFVTGVSKGTTTVTATSNNSSVSDTANITVYIPTTGVTLSPNSLTLNVGDTSYIDAIITPSNADHKDITWSLSSGRTSDYITLRKYDDYVEVTADAEGSVYVQAETYDGQTASALVDVTTVITPATGVSLSSSSMTLKVGDTSTLTATVSPSNASNKGVSWSSSNSSIATVSAGTVTGIAPGTCTITVTTSDGGYTATCNVTVVNALTPVTSVSLNTNSALIGSQGTTATHTVQLSATVLPTNATDRSVSWTSSNTSIATVSSSGLVTAGLTPGTATITATSNDGSKKSDSCSVNVAQINLSNSSANMVVGQTLQLVASASPNLSYTWASSDTSKATVSSSGLVTAVGITPSNNPVYIYCTINGTNYTVNPCAITIVSQVIPVIDTKSITIYNPTEYTAYYGFDNTTSSSLGPGESDPVDIEDGEVLYIARSGSNITITIDSCESNYKVRASVYEFGYDDIVDGDLITLSSAV